ncbi:hypothetical protein SH139x_002966 [Planctomycetaceae bacterium SH139]
MKSSSHLSKSPGLSWSERLRKRYALQLDPSLADWFDAGLWQRAGTGEFNQPVSPDMLLAAAPDVIWPGLMLPDTLPLLGNKYGDWLCLRVGADDGATEVVHWYHGGGDWIPWGRTLAEAIYFDAIRQRLPGRRQTHAVAAEPQRIGSSDDVFLQWALGWLPPAASEWIAGNDEPIAVERLLEKDIASIAVHCEAVLAALDSEFRQLMNPELATELGIAWEPDAVSWLFDHRHVDAGHRQRIEQTLGRTVSFEQDWSTALQHSAAVCRLRDDLSWAWDIAGWAHERAGQLSDAHNYYCQGAFALAFTDQSVRLRSHWYPAATGKFSTWRSLALSTSSEQPSDDRSVQKQEDDLTRRYFQTIAVANARSLRATATEFWGREGELLLEAGRPDEAYRAFYRSGWDLGIDAMNEFRQQLRLLVSAAEQAGQETRAAVAQTHYDCLLERFGD